MIRKFDTKDIVKFSVLLLAIGIGILSYSLTLEPYTNQQKFTDQYLDLATGSMDSEAFWQLRTKMLTPKFKLEDYGATFVAFAALLFLLAAKKFRAPSSRLYVVILALVLPFATVAGYVVDLFQTVNRDEVPSWADSLGIPLMGVPVQIVFLLVWAGAHLGFIGQDFRTGAPIRTAFSTKANWWLLFVSAVTFVFTALLAADGAYLYAVPGALWLYYYLSLAAGRRKPQGLERE